MNQEKQVYGDEKSVTCEECEDKFSNDTCLALHYCKQAEESEELEEKEEEDMEQLNLEEEMNVCEECDEEFPNESSLEYHYLTHEEHSKQNSKYGQTVICNYLNNLEEEDSEDDFYECKENIENQQNSKKKTLYKVIN